MSSSSGCFPNADSNSCLSPFTFSPHSFVNTGSSARSCRLLRIHEEKRLREHDRVHNYPAWAKVLEDACKDEMELRAVLGDSLGDPELMRKRVEDRARKKGNDFPKSNRQFLVDVAWAIGKRE